MPPRLLFLHGVGLPPKIAWQPPLNDALTRLGYAQRLTEDDVIEPDYRHILSAETADPCAVPPTGTLPAATLSSRRAIFEQGQASMRRLLGLDAEAAPRPHGYPADLSNMVTSAAVSLDAGLKQARRYCEQEHRRAAVITTILNSLGDADDLVIVGHSLGSLIALDLLPYLHSEISVRRMITIGGPLGIPWMHRRSERLLKSFPYGQVRSWVNVISTRDLITAGRGAATLFPAAVDLLLTPDYAGSDATRHGAADYLREDKPAQAVGEALFGSLTTELARLETSLEVRPTDQEYVAIFGLAYAHLVANRLSKDNGEIGKRYRAALSVVQAEIHRRLAVTALEEGRVLAQQVDDLRKDTAPTIPHAWSSNIDAALRMLTITATSNLINPFEVDASGVTPLILPSASVALGFGQDLGEKVAQAINDARKCFGTSWFTWDRMLIGAAGVALIAAGPLGLALAAPAGLAGGAAITSALAAFGPGGMVGGMALAGALVSSGAVATTAAALFEQPQAVLELEVVRRMAHAHARKMLGLPQDLTDWGLVVTLANEVDHEHARLSAFSDSRSTTMTSLKSKREMLAKAIDWMAARSLTPPQISA